ncbi:hypothetical protein ED236_00320 [Pseudomethylobacillus aquaticus]|uniref:Uncharacterized protein n=2 Tax=Pseudomethylobacillus aquaticus TaxID=2676064 RepID=A0A3N0V5I5_9PROT|nr:hypothetical protein ED236_00320 [Pseudomethylobacillus aquaticus]
MMTAGFNLIEQGLALQGACISHYHRSVAPDESHKKLLDEAERTGSTIWTNLTNHEVVISTSQPRGNWHRIYGSTP